MTDKANSESDELAAAFFRYYKQHQDGDEWAYEKVANLLKYDPEGAWKVVLDLIESAPTEEALSYVAAWPLEDLLKSDGLQFVERVRQEAHCNRKFLLALACVWLRDSDSIYTTWKQILSENCALTDVDMEALWLSMNLPSE